MAEPGHVFSSHDHLFLTDNNDSNLRQLAEFRPYDGNLALVFEEGFSKDNFLVLRKELPLAFYRWKLKNTW